MKTIVKQGLLTFLIVLLGNGYMNGQVKNDKITTKVNIKNSKISQDKLKGKEWKLRIKPEKGGYVMLESELYKGYLKSELTTLESRKKVLLNINTSNKPLKKIKKIDLKIKKVKAEMKKADIKPTDTQVSDQEEGCKGVFTTEQCNKLRDIIDAQLARVIDEELDDLRPCPDDNGSHCLPLPFVANLRYILVSRDFERFEASFHNENGKQIGKTGKPISIEGIKKYVAYPVFVKNVGERVSINISKSGSKFKRSYTAEILVK